MWVPPWPLTDNPEIRGNTLEGVPYVVDQEVSCLPWSLEVFARETENFAELIDRVGRIVRYVL